MASIALKNKFAARMMFLHLAHWKAAFPLFWEFQ
jgi:hypothetical protein